MLIYHIKNEANFIVHTFSAPNDNTNNWQAFVQELRKIISEIFNICPSNINLIPKNKNQTLCEITPSGKKNDWIRYTIEKSII